MTLRILSVLLFVAGCSGDDSPPPADAGTSRDAHVAVDAGADAGQTPDAGDPDGGGPDAATPDAGGPSDYRVTTGDCVLLWDRTGMREGKRIQGVEEHPDATGDGHDDLVTVASTIEETFVEIRSGTDGSVVSSFAVDGAAYANAFSDVNGDSVPDLLVRVVRGESVDGGGGVVGSGDLMAGVALHSGADGRLLWERIEDVNYGTSAIEVPNAGGGATPDVVVTWPFAGGVGLPDDPPARIQILDGATGALLTEHMGPADAPGFGQGVANIGGATPVLAAGVGRYRELANSAIMVLPLGAATPRWTVVDMPEDFLQLGAALDANGDGTLDPAGTYRDRWLVPTGQGVVTVFDGTSGAELWHYDGRAIVNGHFGVGMARVDDADEDGTDELAAGTSHRLPNLPTIGVPGQLAILSGATGRLVAEVIHAPGPVMSSFAEQIAAFDDPSDRQASGVLALDPSTDDATLTAWSCRAAP